MSQWIWKFGEYEIYHNMLVHSRRQQYGYPEPVVWKVYVPDPVVCFKKTVFTQGGSFRIRACGDMSVIVTGEHSGEQIKYGGRSEIVLEPGSYTVYIRVANFKTFPCIYVDGIIESDESWFADDMTQDWTPVGTEAAFQNPDRTPEKFPFHYKEIFPKKREVFEDGVLLDYGKETFARTRITGLADQKVRVRFGESYEEAMDGEWCVIRFEENPVDGRLCFPPYAFRYLFITDLQAQVTAEYEYLPIEYRGAFHCGDELMNRIWDVAAYTFHLNCREFFLDGIKRDRWVWSADAYQSLFVNRYLFLNKEIEKRTLIALGGKRPFKSHINTIMDYSFFWILSLYEYYITYGDTRFLEQIGPQMDEVMDFCLNRTDEDGFMRERKGDWIFIDWAPMDKTGALCGEQILYAKAMECYGSLCEIVGRGDKGCKAKAARLQEKILEKFYDPEKKAFIDSYESGRKNVTRQNNILAYLFLPCTWEQKKNIYENVILNDEIEQITTPYFKFYENQVYCLEGNEKLLEKSIRTYYGSMLATGATTLYEEYDPEKKGAEHYAMYGNPYEKSLCHAWSASPVFLLGKFRLGVRNTGVAYETFEVRPVLGGLKEFTGSVPVIGGKVTVSMNEREVCVCADIPGGTLWLEGKQYALDPGIEVRVNMEQQA